MSNATKIGRIRVTPSIDPGDGQVVRYDSATNTWIAANDGAVALATRVQALEDAPGGGSSPANFDFEDSLAQDWDGAGPAVVSNVSSASFLPAYFGSKDVPVGNTTDKSNDPVFQSGCVLAPTSVQDTGEVDVKVGDNRGLGNTGTLNILQGSITNAASSGNVGSVLIGGGSNAGSGNGGNVVLQAGTSASGTRGHIELVGLFVNMPTGTADPTGVQAGSMYYNTSTNKLRLRLAASWVDLN